MNRADWQQLAEERLLAAGALLSAGRWPSAYYLAGYAVECGLKACTLVRLAAAPELIFLEQNFSRNCWTHDLDALIRLADLQATWDLDAANNPKRRTYWMVVSGWNEKSRYQRKSQTEAEALYNAIADPIDGVLTWIKARW